MSRSKRNIKRISKRCQNNGGCSYCESNRLYQANKQKERVKQLLKDLNYE